MTGCDRGPSEQDRVLQLADRATFQTVATLGSHHMEATMVTEILGHEGRTVESLDMRWGDWDNFQLRHTRDGAVLQDLKVLEGVAWVKSASGPFKRRRDAELYRVKLSQVWNLWGLALEPFSDDLAYDSGEETIVEGRPAHMFSLRLKNAEEKAAAEEDPMASGGRRRSRHTALELTGTMTLDEGTGVRMVAEMEGRYTAAGGSRDTTVRFREVRTGLGIFPDLKHPEAADGR